MVGSQAGHHFYRRSTPNRRRPGVSTRGERLLAALLLTLAAGAAGPAIAGAEVGAGPYPTSQAVAADAQFLEYAPPPADPGVVCLVDSGVDPNPDTNAALVGSEAEGASWGAGDGLAQTQPLVEGHPAGHGTEMAMLMAAPQNGWGMVGLAPTSVRVYSIRVVPPGETGFPFSAYSYAINRCTQLRVSPQPALTVINLSLAGTTTPASGDLAELENSVDNARQHGIDVVGAAGNDGANGPYYPAAYSSVLSVGAANVGSGNSGELCTFSKVSSLQVIAPGCNSIAGGIDEAFEDDGAPALGFGTSQAAALISSVLAAMRAYEPTLTDLQAETCLKASEPIGGAIDVARAFTACGLSRIVQAGLAAIPDITTAPPAPTAGDTSQAGGMPAGGVAPRTLVGPSLRIVRLRGGRIRVTIANKPTGMTTELKVLGRRRRRTVVLAHRHSLATSVTFIVNSAVLIEARFITRRHGGVASRWVTKAIV
jgi:hypothetical protein